MVQEQLSMMESFVRWFNKPQHPTNLGVFRIAFVAEITVITYWILLWFNKPQHPAGLSVFRILFGFLMILDCFEERGMARLFARYGEPPECSFFPLFNFIQPMPVEWMAYLYLVMLMGAIGVCLGLCYRLSCLAYCICYWYLFLMDVVVWNNHSYLFGLTSLFLLVVDADRYWSVDAIRKKHLHNMDVPHWNYGLIRSQIFLVYFIAGLKKANVEWIKGYSLPGLAQQPCFDIFRYFLSDDMIGLLVVHVGGFLLDLTAGFFLLFPRTRYLGMAMVVSFNAMNSTMFSIGMFPYVMLAATTIFLDDDWPIKCPLIPKSWHRKSPPKINSKCVYRSKNRRTAITKRHKIVVGLVMTYLLTQTVLPYSHLFMGGMNNWSGSLYGYSWDMMIYQWGINHIEAKYQEPETGMSGLFDYKTFAGPPRRWAHNPRTAKQFAQCVAKSFKKNYDVDLEIYLDVWTSLNGRFEQRTYDPNVDLVTAKWSPFSTPSWYLPLLVNITDQRDMAIEAKRASWFDQTDGVLFVADFPGMTFTNYVKKEMRNVNLMVLSGKVNVQVSKASPAVKLETGQSMEIPSPGHHTVRTIGDSASTYRYTFRNQTLYDESNLLKKYTEASNNGFNEHNLSNMELQVGEKLFKEKQESQQEAQKTSSAKVWYSPIKTMMKGMVRRFTLTQKGLTMIRMGIQSILTGQPMKELVKAYYG